MSILALLQSLDLIKWLVALVTGAVVLLGGWKVAKNSGVKEQKTKDLLKKHKQDEATREKVKQVNEKIRTDPSSITRWLHDNNRFRK